jgi:hypothetical protein
MLFLFSSFSYAFVPAKKYRIDTGIYAGVGSQKSESHSIPPTMTANAGLYFSPQLKFGSLGIGPYIDYTKTWQTGKMDSSVMQNLAGGGYLIGPALSWKQGEIQMLFAYTILGEYKYDNETYTGADSRLEKPRGIHAYIGYYLNPKVTLDFSYAGVSYSRNSIGGVENDIGDDRRKTNDIRLGISLHGLYR